MGNVRVKLSRLLGARAGYAAGCATASCGVGVLWGLGVALIVAGVAAAASCLLLVDVDNGTEQRRG